MRAVVNLMFLTVFLVGFSVFAPAAIEPIGQAVIDTGSLTSAQEATIQSFYSAVFVQIPLVAFFGIVAFGVAWYLRRQITIQEGP